MIVLHYQGYDCSQGVPSKVISLPQTYEMFRSIYMEKLRLCEQLTKFSQGTYIVYKYCLHICKFKESTLTSFQMEFITRSECNKTIKWSVLQNFPSIFKKRKPFSVLLCN